MQQRPKVLCLSSWYPNQLKPTEGNFVAQHLKVASSIADVALLHVVLSDQHQTLTIEEKQTPYYEKVIYIPRNKIFLVGKLVSYFQVLFTYWKHAKQTPIGKPEIIHGAVLYPIGVVGLLLKWRFRIPLLFSEHWTCYHPYTVPQPSAWQKIMLKFIGKRSQLLLPVSQDLAVAMLNFGISTPSKVVANVIDTNLFKPTTQRPHQNFRFVHVSSLDPIQKNFHLLVNAFYELKKQQPHTELHVVSDGDFSVYERIISGLDFAESIHFHGAQDAQGVAALLQFADAFVLSSRYENLPCVLLEALSCGTPMIATNVGGVGEIIHQNNGILVPPADKDAMVNAMLAIQNQQFDPEAMHQEAVLKYGPTAIAAQMQEAYYQVLKKDVS
ncbi:MAG: glycosyltransferase [Flavobacteriales bacterium]